MKADASAPKWLSATRRVKGLGVVGEVPIRFLPDIRPSYFDNCQRDGFPFSCRYRTQRRLSLTLSDSYSPLEAPACGRPNCLEEQKRCLFAPFDTICEE
jgi:hypothetical protein